MKYIVGLVFHQTLLDLRSGAIPADEPAFQPRKIISSSLFRITDETYVSYFENILLPYLQKHEDSELTIDTANQQSSMVAVENYLKESNSYLIHNNDDFLLRDGDIENLKKIFGSRMSLFPLGGHLGNVGSEEYMKAVFSSYERARKRVAEGKSL